MITHFKQISLLINTEDEENASQNVNTASFKLSDTLSIK